MSDIFLTMSVGLPRLFCIAYPTLFHVRLRPVELVLTMLFTCELEEQLRHLGPGRCYVISSFRHFRRTRFKEPAYLKAGKSRTDMLQQQSGQYFARRY